jgi:hypothetical protein
MYITKGDVVDLKSIAGLINKKNPTAEPLDGDMLEILHAISHNSMDAFE